MPERYDLVVIGAGPSGLAAGITAAAAGINTLILERDETVGLPVNCAEGVTRAAFERLIDELPIELNGTWIRTTPTRGRVYAPSGASFEMKHSHGGIVLDRATFEQGLANHFTKIGGELRCRLRATGMTSMNGICRCVNVVNAENEVVHIEAPVFIAADGVESAIARKAGISNSLDLLESESYLQYTLTDISVDPDCIEAHLGSTVAPESYAWAFPLSDHSANVGLGVPAVFGAHRPVRDFLNRFVARRFGGGTVARTSCGTSPRYRGPNILARENLLVVGDAARVLDSMTGGGIVTGMASGYLAARAAVAYVRGEVDTIDQLHGLYPGKFVERYHRELDFLAGVKTFLSKLSDDEFNDVVDGLNQYFGNETVESVDVMRTLIGIVKKKPRILRLARHLIS